jgi:glucan phosphoethanolaminetransferase (alkaline phosphatase superfamily)
MSHWRSAARGRERYAFNALFWLGFWLSPMVVQAVEQWPEVNLSQCLIWLKQGVVFTAGFSALAELSGRNRRFFYLLGGLIAWVGAVICILFLASTGITQNTFTVLTGLIYSGHDDAGLRYLLISRRDLVGIAAATCPFLLLVVRWRGLDWPASSKAVVIAGSACLLITGGRWAWHDFGSGHVDGASRLDSIGSVLDPAPPVAAYVTIARALPLARGLMLSPDRSPPRVHGTPRERPLTIIVVVGESTTRNHMGLYGYCRNTTPILTRHAESLFVFRDAISEVPMTVFALSNSFRVPLDAMRGRPDQSVFDVFNAAAFHTYWLSNQFDYPGDPVSSLTRAAQHSVVTYRGKKNGAGYTATLDATLLAPLDTILRSDQSSKLILLHTVGTHSYYEDRVPPGFLAGIYQNDKLNRKAAQTMTIDNYDRAVRYVDLIVGGVIDRADRQGEDIAVIYFSDHGDEVFDDIDFVGHRYPRATRGMVEIPLLVWLSPQLRAAQPTLVAALSRGTTQRMDVRDISPLLLDIAGLRVEGLAVARQPLGDSFIANRRLVGGLDYDGDSNLGIARQLPSLACH